MNRFKTTLLLTALTLLLIFIGGALGGKVGMIIGLLFAAVMNFGSYWYSDKLVLKMYNAQPVTASQAPELHQIVQQLARKANLPMPKVYVVDDPNPNAFATGRNPENAAVAATSGILKILNKDELEGVLAHELSHVYNRDTLTSAIAATLAGAIAMIANMAQWAMIFGMGRDSQEGPGIFGSILMMILAPIAAALIQFAISRSREFAADKKGAQLCGKPLALASALQKLQTVGEQIPMQKAEMNPTTAHLFIINPLSGQKLKHLFSTHPPTQERIQRLKEMARNSKF